MCKKKVNKLIKKNGFIVIEEVRTIKVFGHEKDIQYKALMRKKRWEHLHEELREKAKYQYAGA